MSNGPRDPSQTSAETSQECDFSRKAKATAVKSANDKIEANRVLDPQKAIKAALVTASSLGSVTEIDDSKLSINTAGVSAANDVFITEVGRMKQKFDEKLTKIKAHLETFESAFFTKFNEFFMHIVVNDVALTKNIEYDINNAIVDVKAKTETFVNRADRVTKSLIVSLSASGKGAFGKTLRTGTGVERVQGAK